MRILVVGYGYVGKAMTELLSKRYNVYVYDPLCKPNAQKTESSTFIEWIEKDELKKPFDLVVICVPTPMSESGECDTSIVEESIGLTNGKLYLIKSTVEPGTTQKLTEDFDCVLDIEKRIVFSPEYVGESKYYNSYFPEKMIETPFMVLGGREEDTKEVIDILLPILGPDKNYLQMSSTEAELVKYMENTFFATKITYCQEMFDLCDKVGADWHKVREGWLADPRINPMHTAVFRNDRGFGGKCLPKDTNALAAYFKKQGITSEILEAVLKKNNELRGNRP